MQSNMASLILGCIFVGLIIQIQSYNFGYNNSYTCHCFKNESCDTITGGCNTGCFRGWRGPSCQQENIASDSNSVSQSGIYRNKTWLYGPQIVVDGYNDTDMYKHRCSDTGYSPWAWWFIDLQQHYIIGLQNLRGFSVYIDNELCFKHPGEPNPPAVYPIECSRTITGRYVNISSNRPGDTNNYITLCEVEIYVCSQGTYGSDCNNFCHCSNYDKCDVITGQCPNGCQIGWDGDSCNTSCSTINKYGVRCEKSCDDRQCSDDSTCDHVTGECSNGCKPGYRGIDCSQDCSSSTYGENCSKQCNNRQCRGSQECHHITGTCNDACTPGYREYDCTLECPDGFYGAGCQKNCNDRKCLKNSTCHHETGQCDGGCSVGYSPTVLDCTQECENGLYGAGCNKECSDRNCNDNLICDSKTGDCVDGCRPGFQSFDCTLECDEGFYGYNCSSNCSARFCQSEDDQCNNIDGACDCQEDYKGTDCTVIKEASKDEGADKDTTVIIVAVVVSILGVIFTIFGVVVFLKCRNKDTNHTQNNVYESTSPTTDHVYDDLAPNEHSGNETSEYDSAAHVSTISNYATLGSKNAAENITDQSSPVYYNTSSGVSLDESQKQLNILYENCK